MKLEKFIISCNGKSRSKVIQTSVMLNDAENLANREMSDLDMDHLGSGHFLYLFGEAFG